MPTTMSIAIQHSRSFKIKCIPFLLKRFLWLADAIIAVSKYSAKDLVRFLGIPSSKVCVIYNPVIDDIFFRKSAMELRHPWFSNESISVIVGVGRLSDEKDFPTLIRAFALLRKKSFVKLVILGEGEERARLEELISELGLQDDVCLAGFVENPFPYIKRASVFALSSKWEGLPNALIQAIALGTPSVATDCPGGVSEILKENKNSVLVPVGNVQKFADALLRSLNTKRVVMDRKMTCFHVETVINQYLDLVKTL
jgi:glycosyltransferase involved in cell wall biosynthesis